MNIFSVIGKYISILSKHQKYRIVEIALMMVFGGFLEMLSVSLILPFMEAVMNSDVIMTNKYVTYTCRIFNIHNNRQFLIWLAVIMVFIYIFKNIFLLFQMLIQNKFVQNNRFYTQRKILRSYFARPYEFF